MNSPVSQQQSTYLFENIYRYSWWLLGVLVAALLYLVPNEPASTTLRAFLSSFVTLFIEAMPFLLLGVLLSGFIGVFLSADELHRWLPNGRLARALAGLSLGIALPVGEIGVVPVARRLLHKRLSVVLIVTFLLAAPVLNPITFASTAIVFGLGAMLAARLLVALFVALLIGLLFGISAAPEAILREQPHILPQQHGLSAALQRAADEFFELGRYLIAGIVLAAATQTLIDSAMLLDLLGRGPVGSVFAMQAWGYVAGLNTVLDAAHIEPLRDSLPDGSLIAFLTFGALFDLKSTVLLLAIFRVRAVLYLGLLSFLTTTLAAIWLNFNLAL